MKKLIAVILSAIMALSCVAALAEDPFAALGNYTMIVGHAQPESNPRYISMEKFAADVAEKTNGHVTVEVFGNGQLGTEKEMLEQVVQGVTQGMPGGQYDFSPRLLMFTLPFLANNREEVTALLQSDLAKKVSAEAAETTGTVIINLCDAGGFRQFSNNTRPLTKPEDLKGLKMRTNGMKTIDLTFQAMGANTVSVPYADLYMGLKTSIADGQENPWVNVEGMKFYEVQKYFTEVNYQFHPDPFYVNAEWWASLPAEFQAILSECATEMGEYNDQLIDQNSDAAKQVVVDAGCEVYVPTAEELAAFQEACQPVYSQVVTEGICTQAELEEMLAIVAAVRGE
ncbi:MAG: TRAP transporter substrate-binding protein [bacterium]|nr:TRAP transporter substrate-binding protein [bacterium]